ncbi:hypothetical protein J437_LFUL005102 [Ladona fulva]|uniref:Uncharacterized protein n=1 Tax=Ladona fulva TaxID=123851 RepID=A0A8K0JX54_LADFU|nr:hypothetical protein J437_LFUL005102 [Ladona fulva]
MKVIHGPNVKPRNSLSEIDAFQKCIDLDMIDDIVTFTNNFIDRKRSTANFLRESDCNNTIRSEIIAILLVLYLIGVKKKDVTVIVKHYGDDGTENGITLLTLKKSKREILIEFLPNKSRAVKSCFSGFQYDMNFASVMTERTIGVLFLSLIHDYQEVDDNTKRLIVILITIIQRGELAQSTRCMRHIPIQE